MKVSIPATLRLVILLAGLWPAYGLVVEYDPNLRTLSLTHHVSLDEVLDSGLRPRKLSHDSLSAFRVAIGSVRLDFGRTSFDFMDYGIGLSFSGTGVLTRLDLQSHGIREAPTVAFWFANWSRAMGVPNPYPEAALHGLSGNEDIGTITGLFKDYGAYAISITPRAVGRDLGNGRRYAVDATVAIFSNGKPLDLPIIFAPVVPAERHRSLNLEPYSKEELYELQEVTNNHNEEWLGIPRERDVDLKELIDSARLGAAVPPAPPLAGSLPDKKLELSQQNRLKWAVVGLLLIAGIWLLTKRRVSCSEPRPRR